jgi:hypothetical protein
MTARILPLARIPPTLRGPLGDAYKGQLPARMLFLAPDAAASLCRLESASGGLVYTDMFRSAESSLAAFKNRRGALRPGFSPHNFGLAVDLALGELRAGGLRFDVLEKLMADFGWFCHRRDGNGIGHEAWHFNFLGPEPRQFLAYAEEKRPQTWSLPVEKHIQARHGRWLKMDITEAQAALAGLGLQPGRADGVLGPRTRAAVAEFQRRWLIDEKGLGPITQRTLAYLTVKKEIAS